MYKNSIYLTVFKLIVKALTIRIKKGLGLPIEPIFINFLVTYLCNSRCTMCSIWRRYQDRPQDQQKELSLKEIEAFLKRNQEFLRSVKHFGLTGGEPFLRQDIVGIVKLIRRYLPQATTGLQTNGLAPALIKSKIKEIQKSYPRVNASVSLDGIGITHTQIRGIKDAYKKVLKTLQNLHDLKISRLTSGMVLTEKNYLEIMKVKKTVAKYQAEFSCFPADKADYFQNFSYANNLSPLAKKEIIKVLEQNFSSNYYLDNLRLHLEGKTKRTLPCYSGFTSIVIDPYGNVLPCILRSETLGNIKNQSLKKILASQKAKKIRALFKNCRCWNQCEVTSSAMVDIFNVLAWFIISCRDKNNFLKHFLTVKEDLKL